MVTCVPPMTVFAVLSGIVAISASVATLNNWIVAPTPRSTFSENLSPMAVLVATLMAPIAGERDVSVGAWVSIGAVVNIQLLSSIPSKAFPELSRNDPWSILAYI